VPVGLASRAEELPSQTSDAAIVVRGLSKRFGQTVAADRIDLEVREGEILAVLGPSGCGKTTLLRLIAGFERPDEGAVFIGGREVAGQRWVNPERRGVGFVFQDYALFPHLTVGRNVAFGLPGLLPRGKRERALKMLDLVGLQDVADRYPHQLSGGQQQRVALARALAPSPAVVLLDEPFSNLDADLRQRTRSEIAGILRRLGATAILVTHDQQEAFVMADRVAVLNHGRLEQAGTPESLYHGPLSRFVADFVGEADFITGEIENGRLQTELGALASPLEDLLRADVLVRPDDVRLTLDGPPNAEVTGREFIGGEVRLTLRLGSGQVVHAHQHSGFPAVPGDRYHAWLDPVTVVAFPRTEHSEGC
jgi:iron(III) transport system ATP-binding protein